MIFLDRILLVPYEKTAYAIINMLYELKYIAQKEEGLFRRWFEDNYFELIVWYRHDGSVKGFQLCYDRFGDEHAVTWFDNGVLEHNRVDDDRRAHSHPATAVLVADGAFPAAAIIRRFREESAEIDTEIAELVINILSDYGRPESARKKWRHT